MPLICTTFSPQQIAELSPLQRDCILGGCAIGVMPPPMATNYPAMPIQHIPAPVLGQPVHTWCELWLSTNPCQTGCVDNIHFRYSDEVLYGSISLDETSDETGFAAQPAPTNQPATAALQQATYAAYKRIFRLIDQQGYSHLWRTWNYIPRINETQHGLERYQQFNTGRYDAFIASQRAIEHTVPAASALGTATGGLHIAFIAGKTAMMSLENPRQISAYHYPKTYSPRSPIFSRGAHIALPQQRILFISGTASIVGHNSIHIGDVAAQTRESLVNIAAMLAEAKKASEPDRNKEFVPEAFELAQLSYRVYLRQATDLPIVQSIMREAVSHTAPVVYLQMDICRAELLVEIEASALQPTFINPIQATSAQTISTSPITT